MEKVLKAQLENKSVRVTSDERGLTISLSEAGFFKPGSEILQPPGVDVLDQIVENLLTLPNPVRVEGHTDNIQFTLRDLLRIGNYQRPARPISCSTCSMVRSRHSACPP
jgi:flagellar motor protein MotB